MVSTASSPPAPHRPSSSSPFSKRLSLNPLASIFSFLRRFLTDYFDLLVIFYPLLVLPLVFLLPSSAREDARTWTLTAAHSDNAGYAAPPVLETWKVRCVYPVSGTYTRFQRVLFGAVLTVVVHFRSHRWVLVSGKAWMAGYIVPAVVHAMALTFRSIDGLDADFHALFFIMGLAPVASFGVDRLSVSKASRFGLHFVVHGTSTCFFRGLVEWRRAGQWVSFEVDRWYESESDIAVRSEFENICDVVQVNKTSVFRNAGDRLKPMHWIRSSGPLQAETSSFPLETLRSVYMNHLKSILFGITMTTQPRHVRNWTVRYITTVKHKQGETTPCFVGRTLLAAMVSFWQGLWFNVILLPIAPVNWILTRAWRTFAKQRPGIIPTLAAIPKSLPTEPPPERVLQFSRAIGLLAYCLSILATLYSMVLLISFFSLIGLEENVNRPPELEDVKSVGQWAPWVSVGVAVFISSKTRILSSPRDQRGSEDGALLLHELDRVQSDLGVSIELPPVLERVHHWLLRRAPPLAHGYLQVLGFYTETRIWWNDPFTVSWQHHLADQQTSLPERGQNVPDWPPFTTSAAPGEEEDQVAMRVFEASSSGPRFALNAASNCSRMTYAKYLPCSCANCRGKPCEAVNYSTEEEQTLIEELVEMRGVSRQAREWELMELVPRTCQDQ